MRDAPIAESYNPIKKYRYKMRNEGGKLRFFFQDGTSVVTEDLKKAGKLAEAASKKTHGQDHYNIPPYKISEEDFRKGVEARSGKNATAVTKKKEEEKTSQQDGDNTYLYVFGGIALILLVYAVRK